MKNKISIVILDIGGVIVKLDWSKLYDNLLSKIESCTNASIKDISKIPIYEQFERGEFSRHIFLDHLRSDLEVYMSDNELINAFNSLITKPLEEYQQIFTACTLPYYGLSNISPIHYDYCMKLGVFSEFKHVFTSFNLGYTKPSLEIYTAMLEHLQVPASECLFIDDNQANVDAALRVGMNSVVSVDDPQKTISIIQNYCNE